MQSIAFFLCLVLSGIRLGALATGKDEPKGAGAHLEQKSAVAETDRTSSVTNSFSQNIDVQSFNDTSTAKLVHAVKAAVVHATKSAATTSINSIIVKATYAFEDTLTTNQIRQAIAETHSVAVEKVTITVASRSEEASGITSKDFLQRKRLAQHVHVVIEVTAASGEDLVAKAKAAHTSALDVTSLTASLTSIVGSSVAAPIVVSAPVAKVSVESVELARKLCHLIRLLSQAEKSSYSEGEPGDWLKPTGLMLGCDVMFTMHQPMWEAV